MRDTRLISWIKAARKEFEEFPEDVQSDMFDALWALTVACSGIKTPLMEVDLGRERLKRLKEALK